MKITAKYQPTNSKSREFLCPFDQPPLKPLVTSGREEMPDPWTDFQWSPTKKCANVSLESQSWLENAQKWKIWTDFLRWAAVSARAQGFMDIAPLGQSRPSFPSTSLRGWLRPPFWRSNDMGKNMSGIHKTKIFKKKQMKKKKYATSLEKTQNRKEVTSQTGSSFCWAPCQPKLATPAQPCRPRKTGPPSRWTSRAPMA